MPLRVYVKKKIQRDLECKWLCTFVGVFDIVVICFVFVFCFVIAICDIVHAVETVMPYVNCEQYLGIFSKCDARDTAICSFPGITQISEEISRCC